MGAEPSAETIGSSGSAEETNSISTLGKLTGRPAALSALFMVRPSDAVDVGRSLCITRSVQRQM
ncbi:MAG: hypothetical protein Tsb0020_40910 [Haliangiales bacterium]